MRRSPYAAIFAAILVALAALVVVAHRRQSAALAEAARIAAAPAAPAPALAAASAPTPAERVQREDTATSSSVELQIAALGDGEVVDEQGAPVEGAEVRWLVAEPRPSAPPGVRPVARSTTGTSGTFALPERNGVREGEPEYLVADHPAYALAALHKSRGGPYPYRLVLQQPATVSGIVVDASGSPVRGARVGMNPITDERVAQRYLFSPVMSPVLAETVTDSDGRFALPRMPLGSEIALVAGADGYPVARTLAKADGETTVTIAFEGGFAVVEGVVYHGPTRAQPARDAEVELHAQRGSGPNPSARWDTIALARAGADGRFRFAIANPPGDIVLLRGRAKSGALTVTGWCNASLKPGSPDAELHLASPASATLEVATLGVADHKPVPGVKVQVLDDNISFASGRDTEVTDLSGTARFQMRLEDRPKGTVRLWVRPPPRWVVRVPEPAAGLRAAVPPGQKSRTEVMLARAPAVRGRVVRADGSPPDTELWVLRRDVDDPWHGQAYYQVSPDGTFEATLPEEGGADLFVDGTEVLGWAGTRVVPMPDVPEEVVLTLRPYASVSGRVTGPDGEPLRGMAVFAESPAWPSMRYGPSATTGPDGTYRLRRICAHEAVAVRLAQPREPEPGVLYPDEATVRLADGEHGEEIDFSVSVPGALSGMVLDSATGEPVAGAKVSLTDLSQPGSPAEAVTGEEGMFSFPMRDSAATDAYRSISVDAEGFDHHFERLEASIEEPLLIELVPWERVRVRVVDGLTGEPVERIRYRPAYTADRRSWLEAETPGGEWTIALSNHPYGVDVKDMEADEKLVRRGRLKEGAGAEVVLRLFADASMTGRVIREDGSPAPGVPVARYPATGYIVDLPLQRRPHAPGLVYPHGGGVQQTTTDTDGRFAFPPIYTTDGWNIAAAEGLLANRESEAFTFDPMKEIVLVLKPAAVIEGRLVDHAGNPVAGHYVLCRATAIALHGVGSYTGPDGHFRFVVPLLEDGPSLVRLSVIHGEPEVGFDGRIEMLRREFEASLGTLSSVELRLPETVKVRGVLMLNGEPAREDGEDFVLALRAPQPDASVVETVVDVAPDGTFAFDGAADPGAIEIVARTRNHHVFFRAPLPRGEELEPGVRFLRLDAPVGTLTLTASAELVGRLEGVFGLRDSDQSFNAVRAERELRRGAGSARIPLIPPGDYELELRLKGADPRTIPFTITAGAGTELRLE